MCRGYVWTEYTLITCAQKYVQPHLTPPSATAYEEDRDGLTAQFDAADAMLKDIQAETNAVRLAVEEQREKVEKTTQEVEAVVQEMRKNEGEVRDELREMRDEVQNIRDMLPKVREPLRAWWQMQLKLLCFTFHR